jgi:hypothetical protein
MSAHALKTATARRIDQIADQFTEALIGGFGQPTDMLRYHQGIIQGLRLAIVAQETAYDELGH